MRNTIKEIMAPLKLEMKIPEWFSRWYLGKVNLYNQKEWIDRKQTFHLQHIYITAYKTDYPCYATVNIWALTNAMNSEHYHKRPDTLLLCRVLYCTCLHLRFQSKHIN